MRRKNIVGERIRLARKASKPPLTQIDLIARLQILGMMISQSALSKVESGRRPVTDIEVITLAKALKGQLRLFIVGPGAVTDKEQAILDDIVANPMDIFSIASRNKAALNTLRNAIKRSSDAKLQPYFLQPITAEEKFGFKALK